MLHGWIMEVEPGTGEPGAYDLTWRLFATKREGIKNVHSQISDDWQWIRRDFTWGEDLQDHTGLHGICAFIRLDQTYDVPVTWMGRHPIHSTFVFCGRLRGEAIPFHTEEQAYEIIRWFLSKQEQWHALYSKPTDSEAAKATEAEALDPGSWAAQRTSRQIIH